MQRVVLARALQCTRRYAQQSVANQGSLLPRVLAPVITPFNADGSPDGQELLKQCQWLEANGVGHAIFGTNSEANSMSSRQKIKLLEQLVKGGLDPGNMMPGTGACALDDAVAMTAAAVEAKCAGVLMLPPFYYKDVHDDGLFSFFSEVIQQVASSALKIYVYNIPSVTKIPISLSLLKRLHAAYPETVIGMKDSSGDWAYTESVIKALAPSGFRVYAGSEVFLLRTLRAGGYGCISATANVNPKAISTLANSWQHADADKRQQDLDAVRSVFGKYPLIAGMKTAVSVQRQSPAWARVRPPLVPLAPALRETLLSELAAIKFQLPPV
eukprot:m.787152 g.787152  ORF g.787152 m.787152 type:complete len:327 (+) comp59188_c0_seq6:4752-5732(+)